MFHSSKLLEAQFINLDDVQRKSFIKAVKLHMAVCETGCSNYKLLDYICANSDSIPHFYKEEPYIYKGLVT